MHVGRPGEKVAGFEYYIFYISFPAAILYETSHYDLWIEKDFFKHFDKNIYF